METEELVLEALKKAHDYYSSGDYENSEELYRQILRVDPDNQEALEMGSLAISQNGKHYEAKDWTVRALVHDYKNYRLYNNLGLLHGALNEHEKAIRCFEEAIELNSDEPFLHTNLAIELKKAGDHERMFSVLDRAIEKHNSEHVFFNYGAIVHEFGEIERATQFYKKALEIKYDFPVCHYNLSACYFLLGDYKNGWKEYEWRWKHFHTFAKLKDRFKEPYWQGEDLRGKTIVLYNEQGVGDTIMMSRFIPLIKNMGAKVVLECIAPLQELMKSCDGIDVLCERYSGPLDYHCSLMTIPSMFDIVPPANLRSNLLRSSAWETYSRPRIGICWTGNPMHPNDRNRSCRLADFAGIGSPLFSFQYDTRPHQYPDIGVVDYTKGGEELKVIDLKEHMKDFNCTAKLVEEMDVVVTVDSVIAHLAGIAGVPTFLLLPFVPDWRWGIQGEKTKWYPNFTIVRQRNHGRWDTVFEDVRRAITITPLTTKS